MKHPMLNRWIRFRIIPDQPDMRMAVDLLQEKERVIPAELAIFASRLDGHTDPYSIWPYSDEECTDMLRELDKHDMLRRSRVLTKSFLSLEYSIWFPRRTRLAGTLARIFNTLLLISWLPMLVIGVLAFISSLPALESKGYYLGFVGGLLSGVIIHELSHGNASLSYGAPFFEMGISIGLSPGAYILTKHSMVKGRWKRLQISAAGVESNFLLTGLFFMLSARFESADMLFFAAAMINLVLGLFNLTLANGLDGMGILNELLGEENFVARAKKIVKNKDLRLELRKSATGQAAIVSGYMIVLSQISTPLLIILNFVELFYII